MRAVIRSLLLPPGCCLVLAALGALVWRWRPRLGRGLVAAAAALLWCLSTPAIAGALLSSLQTAPALPAGGPIPDAQAIVILSAEAEPGPEYGQLEPGRDTLVRLRYGAHLQRRTGLPILVTGGPPAPHSEAVADAMRRTLEEDFAARVTWIEREAQNTFENARGAARLLATGDIERVLLVTHAWHIPRAQKSFEAQGLTVIPAPTGFRDRPWRGLSSLIPSWTALRDSAYATREWIGRAVYAVIYP
ncbi:MAG: YdcF family protein [Haliangiales bacterium]